jgi:hypothetical protein
VLCPFQRARAAPNKPSTRNNTPIVVRIAVMRISS